TFCSRRIPRLMQRQMRSCAPRPILASKIRRSTQSARSCKTAASPLPCKRLNLYPPVQKKRDRELVRGAWRARPLLLPLLGSNSRLFRVRRASMMGWLAQGLILTVVFSLMGCPSTPTAKWANERIGFTRAPQLGGTDQLWIMNGNGSGQSQLDLGAYRNSSLTWSPDGNYIAFESTRDGNLEIYTARIVDNGDETYSAQEIQRMTTHSA